MSPLTFDAWEEKGVVRYNSTDVVEVLIRVVLQDSRGKLSGRLVFWDGPRLSMQAAEMLASPVIDVMDARYAPADVAGVEVWQCRTKETHSVPAAAARGMRAQVEAHIARMSKR